jgi:SH3/ankyrin repeat-containing protein
MLIALVNGGGIVDFRNRADGSTAVHKAVIKNNIEALQTLLDLGASPNYKDLKGLTPLYYWYVPFFKANFSKKNSKNFENFIKSI